MFIISFLILVVCVIVFLNYEFNPNMGEVSDVRKIRVMILMVGWTIMTTVSWYGNEILTVLEGLQNALIGNGG